MGLRVRSLSLAEAMDTTLLIECLWWTLVGPLMHLGFVHQLLFCAFNLVVYGASQALQNLEPDPTAAQLAEDERHLCGIDRSYGTSASWAAIAVVYCLLIAHACERAERRVYHLRLVGESR